MASLIRYDRWLCHASKRAEYWHSRLEDVRREQALAAQRAEHARHGADLQRAAWSQRALAQQERQRVTKLNQMRARGVKREAKEKTPPTTFSTMEASTPGTGAVPSTPGASADDGFVDAVCSSCGLPPSRSSSPSPLPSRA